MHIEREIEAEQKARNDTVIRNTQNGFVRLFFAPYFKIPLACADHEIRVGTYRTDISDRIDVPVHAHDKHYERKQRYFIGLVACKRFPHRRFVDIEIRPQFEYRRKLGKKTKRNARIEEYSRYEAGICLIFQRRKRAEALHDVVKSVKPVGYEGRNEKRLADRKGEAQHHDRARIGSRRRKRAYQAQTGQQCKVKQLFCRHGKSVVHCGKLIYPREHHQISDEIGKRVEQRKRRIYEKEHTDGYQRRAE